MGQQFTLAAKKADSLHGFIRRRVVRMWREVVLTLYSHSHSHLECCVQFRAPQYKRDKDILEQVQQKARKVKKGLELDWIFNYWA